MVDLFDVEHAQKVLSKFGQAFGKLPPEIAGLSEEEREFVGTVASGLGQDGKVVSVRLALFAEMVKGKPWVPATLEEVGGTEGIGINFLEETFSSRTANPKHRLHQQAAREVLKALLPEVGTDIKGHMRSHAELLETSGYQSRPGDFNDLLRILDGELRLITPTDPEGFQTESDSDPGSKFYQLTHDYLVPSLRDWLTRKQKETRRGRAELNLAERSALWNAKPENRHLPAWWEYCNIRLLTSGKKWIEPQRRMMTRARRVLGIRWGSALLITFVIGVTIQQLVSAARHRNLFKQVRTTVSSLNTSRGIIQPPLKHLDDFPREIVLAELREQFEVADDTRKLTLAFALAHFDDVRVEFLVSQVEAALPNEVDNFVFALNKSNAEAVSELETAARTAEGKQNWKHKVRIAMLALWLKSPMLAQEMCRFRPDPIQRTLLIEECSTWHGNLSNLAQLVSDNDDGPLRSGIILAVGSVPFADVLPPEKQAWEPVLSNWFTTATDSITHSAAGWTMRKWNLESPEITKSKAPADGMNWHVNSIGMTLLKIPAGSFVRRDIRAGAIDQKVTLTRSFLLADCVVTLAQFQKFLDDPDYSDAEKPKRRKGAAVGYAPTEQHPVRRVNWNVAILFCNWLSRREGLMSCYELTGNKKKIRNQKFDAWRLISDANGYRLPTEAEWEYACRAGTVTTFSYGDDVLLLNRYAVVRSSRTEIPGSKLPNGWGLFDVHGNVWEWCQDWYGDYGNKDALTNPIGSVNLGNVAGRVLRGGSFPSGSTFSQSAYRTNARPVNGVRIGRSGFRVARNYH